MVTTPTGYTAESGNPTSVFVERDRKAGRLLLLQLGKGGGVGVGVNQTLQRIRLPFWLLRDRLARRQTVVCIHSFVSPFILSIVLLSLLPSAVRGEGVR